MKHSKKLIMFGLLLAVFGIIAGGYLFGTLLPLDNLFVSGETIDSAERENVEDSKENDAKASKKAPADTTPPVITKKDVTVARGVKVNILENVTAKDNKDGDLTSKVKTNGTVDTSKVGKQAVKLSVADKSGNTATAEKVVTVKEPVAVNFIEKSAQAASAEESPSETQATSQAPAAEKSPAAENNQQASVESKTQPKSESQTQAPANNSQSAANNSQPAAAKPKPTTPAYSPMTIYLAGVSIPYRNGGQGSGQSIIDSNPYGAASTWGGSDVQSGSDGLNTHFIGHNPGVFGSLFSLGSGSQIIVTDSNGTPTTYIAKAFLKVNDAAIGISDGKNYWTLITGTGGGERITLQTCIDSATNYIVIAYA